MGRHGRGIFAQGGPEGYAAELAGDVEIGGDVSINSSRTRATLIELGEGPDYAEGFDVAGETKAGPTTKWWRLQ